MAQFDQLLMLASSNLPIGSYTYSQGIESAIELRLIHDEASALLLLQQYQQDVLCGCDLPLLAALMQLITLQATAAADGLADFYQASRDSQEFVLESQQLAQAFSAWITAVLQLEMPVHWQAQGYLPLFARLCSHWQVPIEQALATYRFAQMENLTLAIVKTLPLGQMAGQRLIWALQQQVDTIIQTLTWHMTGILQPLPPFARDGDEFAPIETLDWLLDRLPLSTAQPGLGRLSCLHEQQYSRLFRS